MEPINWSMFKENCGDDEGLVDEIVTLFLREGVKTLGELGQAVEASDFELMRQRAHRLKGALLSLAAIPCSDAVKELEEIGARTNASDPKESWQKLTVEFARLKTHLEMHTNSRTPAAANAIK
jgi:HPt (histidine-containing phosphotransfer) domain-containing protein